MNWLYALSFVHIPRWAKWIPVGAGAGFLLGGWIAYGVGHDAGHALGVRVGERAQSARQAQAQLQGSRKAIGDREAAENETTILWDRAGGDLDRLCKADPACRDRYRLRLGEEDQLVAPGHASDREGSADAQRHPGQAMPGTGGGVR